MTRYARAMLAVLVVALCLDYQHINIVVPSVGIGLVLGAAFYIHWPVIRLYLFGPKRPRRDDDLPPYFFL